MAWTIDPTHTSVSFSAKHLGVATVRGRFTRFDGSFDLGDGSDPTTFRGRAEIDVASVDTGNEQRDGHLRGADFFDVEKYPTMVFEARSISPDGGAAFTVVGDLTIKDVTREITLTYEHNGTVQDPWGNTKVGGTLTGTINRSDFGLTWNVPLGGGGLLVSERVKLEIDGELALSTEAVAEEARAESASV